MAMLVWGAKCKSIILGNIFLHFVLLTNLTRVILWFVNHSFEDICNIKFVNHRYPTSWSINPLAFCCFALYKLPDTYIALQHINCKICVIYQSSFAFLADCRLWEIVKTKIWSEILKTLIILDRHTPSLPLLHKVVWQHLTLYLQLFCVKDLSQRAKNTTYSVL